MPWRPLSKRGQHDPVLDEPAEGVPPYLRAPLLDWITEMIAPWSGRSRSPRKDTLEHLQLSFRLIPPLNTSVPAQAMDDLMSRVSRDEQFALDVVDYLLHHIFQAIDYDENIQPRLSRLQDMLRVGGSVWEVTVDEESFPGLTRRALGPVRDAIADLPHSSRAHQHLVTAWNRLSGRAPDPSTAYREAVRAIEAAAKPVILPTNDRATLGTMISALRDKPEKWKTTLGTVDDVRRMMEIVWTNQLDRHGTDDETVPLTVTLDDADAAVHISLTLARLFVGGHVRRNG